MKTLLEKSRYLVLIAVIAALAASLAVFAWGGYKTTLAIADLLNGSGSTSDVVVSFIKIMDILLIGMALLIFALAVYELFVEDLDLPAWLVIHDFQGLKGKLSSVVILVMGVTFLEHLVDWQDAQGTFMFGIGIAVVSAALIAFIRLGGHGD